MNIYHEDAVRLRAQVADLEDANPLKLCALTLACISECYGAGQEFERQATLSLSEDEKQFNLGAAQAARTIGDRLLISIEGSVRSIVTDRGVQNAGLQKIIDNFVRKPNAN